MNSISASHRELLREVLRLALDTRARIIVKDQRLTIRDVYALSYHVARELHGRFQDIHIMIGDRLSNQGLVQHHWIEIPSHGIYIDPACDALDAFQAVRVGNISDQEFASTYRNGLDANIDVADPRNRPEILFKSKSAFDSEA